MHIIRLRHPWQKQIDAASKSVNSPTPIRVQVPEPASADAPSDPHIQSASYTRFFNRPTGLNQNSQVLLRIDSWQGKLTSISLNAQPLVTDKVATQPPLEIHITPHLSQRNELIITLSIHSDVEGRLTGEVELAIVD